MIIPKGKIRHQDLMTSYTNLSALLSTLKSEGFSGTIEVEFPENKGILFIDTGEIVNAEVKVGDGSKRTVGPEAVQHLLTLANRKDGVLNIYQLLPEQTAIVARNLDHEILFKELSTDFTRFDRLLLKLREEKHFGFIEVFTKDHQPMGVLFLDEGEPIEMFTTSASGTSVFGRKSIPMFVENAVRESAVLNVYRALCRMTKEGAVKVPESVQIPKEEGQKIETEEAKNITKVETKKYPLEEKKIPSEEKKILVEDKRIQVEGKKITEKEIKGFHPEETMNKVPFKEEVSKISKEELPIIEEKDERKVLLLILQEILSNTERLVDEVSQKGKFLTIFKKALLEKSNKYLFLDPFSGEFDYRNGAISFNGDVGNSELAKGVVDCLKATLFKVEKELPKKKTLSLKLTLEIETTLRLHREALKRLGVEVDFSPFYQ